MAVRSMSPLRTQVASLAETLAETGLAISHGLFPESLRRDLEAEARHAWADGAYRRAGVGRGVQRRVRPEIRSDHVLWLDPEHLTAAQSAYFETMEALRVAIHRSLFLPVHELEAHFTLYPPGAFYVRHLDQFPQAAHRLVSCLLYLNRDWRAEDGGQLRLYQPSLEGGETSIDVLPADGTFVCFLSDRLEHEVLPTQRPRLSLTGWFRRRD